MKGGKYLLLAILLYFTYRMALLSWPYLALDDRVAFLRIKQSVVHLSWWKAAFYVHVFTSILLLLAGFTQFSTQLLKRYPSVHRGAGRLYVFVLLFLSGPAGLLLAIKANGGVWSQLAFTTLAVLWWWFTWRAWRSIIKGQIKVHQDFMWRSFVLTLSAVTLRSWKWLIVLVWAPPPMDTYRLVAWLGWVPNLLLVELWIRRKKAY
ncbi:DUF2306 domain-containing protein [Lewinella cohaerens]|uniref:DUF2306 domain-containing protein n=1 Tax=Lewinella cohaerens TaxID=70995 RepID=UPI001FE0A24D|nr:DUF2306 domain-containing protein [Lewinella cohaerens]